MGTKKKLDNGVQFTIEWDGVKQSDPIFHNVQFKSEVSKALDDSPFPINTVGYYEDTDNFVVEGEIIRETKKEVDAEFTLFVARMLRVLCKYYPKAKNINRARVYFKIASEEE